MLNFFNRIYIKYLLNKELKKDIKKGILRKDSKVIWNKDKNDFEIQYQYSEEYAKKLRNIIDTRDVDVLIDKRLDVRASDEYFGRIEKEIFKNHDI